MHRAGWVARSRRARSDIGFTKRWYSACALRVGGEGSRLFAVLFSDITEQKVLQLQQEYWMQLNDELRSLGDPVMIEETVTRIAMDYFGADRCFYARIEDGKAIVTRDAARGGLPLVAGVYPLESFTIFDSIVKAGRPFIVADARDSEIIDDTLRQICLRL